MEDIVSFLLAHLILVSSIFILGIYAITKRAKRKAEKAVVVDASPTDSDDPFQVTNATPEYSEPFEKDASWMPTMDSVNPAAQVPKPPSSSFTKVRIETLYKNAMNLLSSCLWPSTHGLFPSSYSSQTLGSALSLYLRIG